LHKIYLWAKLKLTRQIKNRVLVGRLRCKTGTMITIEVFGKRGPPEKYLMEKQTVPVN
jgi:hypothetical protein